MKLEKAAAPLSLRESEKQDTSRPTAWLPAYFCYLLVQIGQLLALFALAPRFFWLDDSQVQFGPMAWWLGKNLRGGRPPLMDADFGLASNLAADMQYGVLDPLHWGLQYLAALTGDFITMSWVYGTISILLLGSGSFWLLVHYKVRGAFAVAGALGIASSGFFLWYGSSWWPVMWSTAWLPWLWVGLASKKWPGVIAAGVATWAILTSGNPYSVPFAALIFISQVWESRSELGSFRALMNRRFISRVTACAGGLVVASPTLMTTVQLAPLMLRPGIESDAVLGHSGFAIPNLLDVVIGGTTLLGQTNFFDGKIARSPAMATLMVALPLLALVHWRTAFRKPGVVTAMVLYGASLIATQLPTTVTVFRYPVRYLVVVQLALPLLALIAVSAAPRLTKNRIVVAGLLVLIQLLVSVLRAPVFVAFHSVAFVLTALASVAAIALLASQPRDAGKRPAGRWFLHTGARRLGLSVIMIASIGSGLIVGEQMMVELERRVNLLNDVETPEARPYRAHFPAYDLGVTEKEYRLRSWALDKYMSVIAWGGFEEDRGWVSGILSGNANLLSGLKPGFGSLAVWQSHLNKHWCNDYLGATCDAAGLLSHAEGTSKAWIDLVTSETVLLEKSAPPEIGDYFARGWTKVAEDERWVELHQERGLPGTITDSQGVSVSARGWSSGPAYSGEPFDQYVVGTGQEGGSLIFRIPYWPGLAASLDGRPIEVGSLDKSLLKVTLPGNLTGAKLRLFYNPIGAQISTGATAAGLAIILLSAVFAARVTPRNPGRKRPRAPLPAASSQNGDSRHGVGEGIDRKPASLWRIRRPDSFR